MFTELPEESLASLPDFWRWWRQRLGATQVGVTRVPLDRLDSWGTDPRTGNLCHRSGRFFTVEAVRSRCRGVIDQRPILHQPEVGILGLLVRQLAGRLWVLVQAKMEPGNANVLQLSPTVQATWSNYTRVHGGQRTRYLDYFTSASRRTLVDVNQSEHGYWFWRKRNRNVAVRVNDPVPVADHHRWLPLDLLRRLVGVENLVNMDTRSVLACLPFVVPTPRPEGDLSPFEDALIRSYHHDTDESCHSYLEIVAWLADARKRSGLHARLVPLVGLPGWNRTAEEIVDDREARFRIVGVQVESEDREVGRWSQPLLAPCGVGLARLVVRPISGVLHLLVHARPESGLRDKVEVGPTVRLLPGETSDPESVPSWQAAIAAADGGVIRFDTVLSEEGGRFYHALTRYQVVEVDSSFPLDPPADFRWVTVRQLMLLIRRGFRVTIEARSLLGALHSMW